MAVVLNLVLTLLILGLTYALVSEGLWGAALMFFNVLFAGIVAFNFYEPLATLVESSTGINWGFTDTSCLLTLFIVTLVMLRLVTETLSPTMVRFPNPVYQVGRVVFGLATSLVTVAILLLAFETAPVHKKVFGIIDYKTRVPFGLALDHQWLGFFQYTTGMIFANRSPQRHDPFGEYSNANVFDPRAQWLLIHQDARPYGIDMVLGGESGGGGDAAAAGAAAPAGPAAAPVGRPAPPP
jgi:hypothetical protein